MVLSVDKLIVLHQQQGAYTGVGEHPAYNLLWLCVCSGSRAHIGPREWICMCEIAQIDYDAGLPCPQYGPDTDNSWWFRCGYFALPVDPYFSQEGATPTVHKTNTSCGQGAPGRLGGTRSVRRATTNEHVEQAWRGWADDKFRQQCPTDAKLMQQHMYIYI